VDRNLVVNTGPAIEDGYRAALQALNLPSRPTAVIAINDLLAIVAIRAAADLGLQIPADLSLVGYDDIFPTNYLVPRLSTVSKDAVRMGCEAVRLVLERIRNPDLPRRVIEISARFIIRESIGPAPS
jgi:DNA-binding LacI/PurR family transcriptional regulator